MTYQGGKAGSGVYQQIINQIPPHRVYIAPFLGNDAVLRKKRPAQISIGMDLDPDVVAAWNARCSTAQDCDIGHPEALALRNTAGSIEQSFDALEGQEIGQNVPGLIVKNCDAISFLSSYAWQGDEYVYCDPPYLYDVRSSKRRQLYKHELGEPEQHRALLTILRSIPCNLSISGYWSEMYADMLLGWRTIYYPSRTRGGRTVTEWLWMNYPEPAELHDYRYLGSTFRQRERISRIRKNMIAKLARMDSLERYAILAGVDEYKSGQAVGNQLASQK